MIDQIILVADRVSTHKNAQLESNDLEALEDSYYLKLEREILDEGFSFKHLASPTQLLDEAPKLTHTSLILPLWAGKDSRNRRALIPSICEAYELSYIGADTYVHVLCQDKHLAKKVCADAGFKLPNGALISNLDFQSNSVELIEGLCPPLVVKPNFGGGSIGIGTDSLVESYKDAWELAKSIHAMHRQPVLVEEFVQGTEASIVFVGNLPQIFLEAIVEYELLEGSPLSNTIYSLELKKSNRNNTRQIASKLDARPELQQSCRNLLKKVGGKIDLFRIDGRFDKKGCFWVIELSPDSYIGPQSSFEIAAGIFGKSYGDILQHLVTINSAS